MAYQNQLFGQLWSQRALDEDDNMYTEIYLKSGEGDKEIGTVLNKDGQIYFVLIFGEDQSLVFPVQSLIDELVAARNIAK